MAEIPFQTASKLSYSSNNRKQYYSFLKSTFFDIDVDWYKSRNTYNTGIVLPV